MPTLHLPTHSLIHSLVHSFIQFILSRFIIDRRQILQKEEKVSQGIVNWLRRYKKENPPSSYT